MCHHILPWPWWLQSFNENPSFLKSVVNKDTWMNKDICTHNFLSLTFSSFEWLKKLLPCTRFRYYCSHSWEMVVGHQSVLCISSHIDYLKPAGKGIETERKQNREILLLNAKDIVFRRILDYPLWISECACIFCDQDDHTFWSSGLPRVPTYICGLR